MKNKLFLVIILVSCMGQKKSDEYSADEKIPKDFYRINIESLEDNQKVAYLSNIASKAEYIQLETNDNCIINANPRFLFADSLILVNNTYHVLKYSCNGKFLGRIGEEGRGPGELDAIETISIIPNKKTVAIHCEKKMSYFSLKGDFLNSTRVPSHINMLFINDDEILVYDSGNRGYEFYNFLLTNVNHDTIASVENYDKWRNFTSVYSI